MQLKTIKQAKEVLQLLSTKPSVAILGYLKKHNNKCVSDIMKSLKMQQSVTSNFLGKLRNLEIVTFRRDGKFIYYSLNEDRLNKILYNCSQIIKKS